MGLSLQQGAAHVTVAFSRFLPLPLYALARATRVGDSSVKLELLRNFASFGAAAGTRERSSVRSRFDDTTCPHVNAVWRRMRMLDIVPEELWKSPKVVPNNTVSLIHDVEMYAPITKHLCAVIYIYIYI